MQQLQYVDLGCGCGSVLMHLAWAFPQREVRHPCPHLEQSHTNTTPAVADAMFGRRSSRGFFWTL